MKVLQHRTPIVEQTSGILRFWRCLLGAETSVVTTHRLAGDANPYAIRKGSRPSCTISSSVKSGVPLIDYASDEGFIDLFVQHQRGLDPHPL